MPRMGSANPAFVPYQCFETADRYIFVGVTNDRFWQGFCQALGLDEIGSDQRYATSQKRLEHRDELVAKLGAVLKKHPSDEVLASIEAAGIPCAPVLEIPEVVNDPQVQARQILFEMDYPGVGKMKLAHIPFKASGMELINTIRAPLLGEHTQEILLNAGYSQAEIDALEVGGVIFKHKK